MLTSLAKSSPHHHTPTFSTASINKALRVLDLIKPFTSPLTRQPTNHARLIQSCLQAILHRPTSNPTKRPTKTTVRVISDNTPLGPTGKLHLFVELHRRGFDHDPVSVSGVLSFCGASGDVRLGLQLQCLSVKSCLDGCGNVGSALIGFYSKLGALEDACKVFGEMGVRSTVTYTSIVAACAQHFRVGLCVGLFGEMRRCGCEPNDFTFTSVLSACVGTGCLGFGRSVHGLEFKMGFGEYVHVCNALVSMYAKCGSIGKASCLFERMETKDIVSWNTMISGYAQYGLAWKALDLLEEMETSDVKPDAITFLGVLSSCRHAGLVERGRACFILMLERGLVPAIEHYSCIADLFGRAGLLEEALGFIMKMPIPANAVTWGSLLSSCKVYGNIHMGISAAKARLLLEPGCAATHVQLANLYAAVGCWDGFAKIRKLMKERGMKTSPGCSWIEVENQIHKFKAEGRSEWQVTDETDVLDNLDCHMKDLGYGPEMDFDIWMKP